MKPRKTEHPILFSTPMVQAILEGRKTMTRRIVNMEYLNKEPYEWSVKHIDEMLFTFSNKGCAQSVDIRNPYGQPGDKLWVRETFCDMSVNEICENYLYKASDNDLPVKWSPSIHMPKSAARIWLEITDVRVERLQSISKTGAIAEGVEKRFNKNYCDTLYVDYGSDLMGYYNSVDSFRTLWSKINGKENWDLNPWVWVIEFKRIEPCQ